MKKLKKILAFNLAFSLCFGYLPTVAYAEEGQGHMECEHHQVHTAECGYSEGIEGSPCNHKCTLESGCVINANTEENNTKEEGEVSDNSIQDNSIQDNSIQDNSIQDNSIQLEVVCTHTEHDENCGYLEAVEGSECTYFCRVCQIQNLMNQLPDEVNENNQAEVEKMLSEIDNLKSGLTDQETGLLHVEKYENVSNMLANILNEVALPLESSPKVKLTSVAPMLATTANSKDVVYTKYQSGSSSYGTGTADSPYNMFVDALRNVEDGGTIIVDGHAYVQANDGVDGDTMPFVINKNVTIKGSGKNSYLSIRPAGIILGGNVTFENLSISLENNEKNAIFANGHNLTLTNVSKQSGSRAIHVFAGGLVDATINIGKQSSATKGSNTIININGTSTVLGNIYAGAMNTSFDGNVTVNISDISTDGVGEIYASGAYTGYYNGEAFLSGIEPEPPAANVNNLPSNGKIDIYVTSDKVRAFYGQASVTNKANVILDTNTQYLMSNLILDNVGIFTLRNGVVEPGMLTPETSISLGTTAELNLASVMDNVGYFEMKDLHGENGAKLRFGKNGQLLVYGNFTGTVEFQTNDNRYYDGLTSGDVINNTVYIDVAGNNTGNIIFNPNSTNSTVELVNKNGKWTTQTIGSSGGDIAISDTLIKTLVLDDPTQEYIIDRNALHNGNDLTVKIKYTTNGYGDKWFENFPISYLITRGGEEYNLPAEPEGDQHQAKSDDLNLIFTHVEGDPADDNSYFGGEIYIGTINNTKLLGGEYNIKILVPKEYTVNNTEISADIKLNVNYEKPSSPQNLRQNNVTADSITVSWDKPSDLGGASEDEIKYKVYVDGVQKGTDISSTEYKITGLAANTEYNIQVSAYNDNISESDKSNSLTLKTLEGVTPPSEHQHILKDDTWHHNGGNTHWQLCVDGHRMNEGSHTPGPEATETTPQTCTQCGYEIAPVLNHRHSWSDWISNGDNTHTHTCIKDSNHKETLSCNGGVATCRDLAICKDCKAGYGLLDKTNHVGGTYLDGKKEPTQETDGYTGDTKCNSCDEIITKGSTVKYQGSQEKPGTNPGQGEGSQEKPGTNPGQGEGSQEKPGTNPGQGEGSQEKPGTNPGQGEGSQEKPGTNPGQVTDNQNNQQANNGNMGQTGNSSSSSQAASSSITSSVHQNRREQSTQNKEATTSQVVQNYIVQKGDSLSKIAKRYGCTVGELVEANRGLIKNSNLIHIGWKLQIPVREAGIMNGNSTAATMFTPPDNRPIITYIIKRGDSLWKIARLNGCSIEDLIAFNTDTIRNPNVIIAGKELRIPQN